MPASGDGHGRRDDPQRVRHPPAEQRAGHTQVDEHPMSEPIPITTARDSQALAASREVQPSMNEGTLRFAVEQLRSPWADGSPREEAQRPRGTCDKSRERQSIRNSPWPQPSR